MSMLDEIVQFSQARKATADKILEQIRLGIDENTTLLSAAPKHPITTAEQWKEAGGTVPLAPAPDIPRAIAPQIMRQGEELAGPVVKQDMQEQVTPYEEPNAIVLARQFVRPVEKYSPVPKPDRFDRYGNQLWAIGYGSQTDPRTGKPVDEKTEPMDQTEADAATTQRLTTDNNILDRVLKVEVTDKQRAALLSFMYNHVPKTLERSTLLRRLNAGAEWEDLLPEFLKFVGSRGRDGKLEPLRGLKIRRTNEHTHGTERSQTPNLEQTIPITTAEGTDLP